MRVLFLAPLRYAASIAFLHETLAELTENGHQVTLLVSAHSDPPFGKMIDGVSLETFDDRSTSDRLLFTSLQRRAYERAANESPDIVIGMAEAGLIVAGRIHRKYGIPFVYYNDEIHFGDERKSFTGLMYGKTIKQLERRALRSASFTVTQDPMRGKFVAEVQRIPFKSLRFLPNSRRGEAKSRRSDYLHRMFGIDPSERLVLWMGNVNPGDGALELARDAVNWPEGRRMVFHFRRSEGNAYMREIASLHQQGQVLVSTTPIPFSEVDELAASASIGMGIYADRGINARYIGHSSGKVNTFLQMGIPCIVADYEGLRWVQEEGAGMTVVDTLQVGEAVDRILASEEEYRKRSINLFNERLRFETAFAPIMQEMESVAAARGSR